MPFFLLFWTILFSNLADIHTGKFGCEHSNDKKEEKRYVLFHDFTNKAGFLRIYNQGSHDRVIGDNKMYPSSICAPINSQMLSTCIRKCVCIHICRLTHLHIVALTYPRPLVSTHACVTVLFREFSVITRFCYLPISVARADVQHPCGRISRVLKVGKIHTGSG